MKKIATIYFFDQSISVYDNCAFSGYEDVSGYTFEMLLSMFYGDKRFLEFFNGKRNYLLNLDQILFIKEYKA